MNITILDDYQDAVRGLSCFAKLAGHSVTVHRDSVSDADALVARLAEADAVVLIRERTRIPAAVIARLPKLKILSQTGGAGKHIDIEACTRAGIVVCAGTGAPDARAAGRPRWAVRSRA